MLEDKSRAPALNANVPLAGGPQWRVNKEYHQCPSRKWLQTEAIQVS